MLRDAGSHPDRDYPDYRSTRPRHPHQPLIHLPHTVTERDGTSARRPPAGPRARLRPHAPARRRADRRAHHRDGRVLDGERPARSRRARRDLAGERRPGATGTAGDRGSRRSTRTSPGRDAASPTRTGRFAFVTVKPGAVPMGQSPERVAAGAHPLLAARSSFCAAARDADVLPGRPAASRSTRSSTRSATRRRASGMVSRFSIDRTRENWADRVRWDIALRGRDETPVEEGH